MGRIKSTKRHGLDFMGFGHLVMWQLTYQKPHIITDI